jgi:hypothetical protein
MSSRDVRIVCPGLMVVSALFLLKHFVGDSLCPGVVPTCDSTDISTQNMMGSHFGHYHIYTISKFSSNKAYTFQETDVRVARNFDVISIGYLEFCDLSRTNRTSVYKLYVTWMLHVQSTSVFEAKQRMALLMCNRSVCLQKTDLIILKYSIAYILTLPNKCTISN